MPHGDHKIFLSSLTAGQRAVLTARSNSKGLLALLLHVGVLLFVWLMVLSKVPGWPLLILPLGILIVFLFTLMHETSHRTAFKSRQVNIVISWCCGVVLLLPPNWFRYFHFAHHRYTQNPQRDPELTSPKPDSFRQYMLHVSGLPVWCSQLKTLMKNACGCSNERYIPEAAKQVVRLESQLIILFYVVVITVLVAYRQHHALGTWTAALLIGQPFLRLYLLAEHGKCPFVDNMFENTRTTFTNRFVRKLAWNMPYHAEHHAYPNVPFHQLPALHALVKDQLTVTSDGYTVFNLDMLRSIDHQ